jgi:hypothetical protein
MNMVYLFKLLFLLLLICLNADDKALTILFMTFESADSIDDFSPLRILLKTVRFTLSC